MSFLNNTKQICYALHTQTNPAILCQKPHLPLLYQSNATIWVLSALASLLWHCLLGLDEGVHLNDCICISWLNFWPKMVELMWRLTQAQPNRFIHLKAEGSSVDTSNTTFQLDNKASKSCFPFPTLLHCMHIRNWDLLSMEYKLGSEQLVAVVVFVGEGSVGEQFVDSASFQN